MIKYSIRIGLLLLFALCGEFATAQTRVGSVHQVEKGETLYSLSRRYGVTVEALLSVNPDISSQPNKKIKRGYLINIPEAVPVQVADTFKMAVVLPFSAEGKEGERSIEFYRGLLMAADAERENGRCVSIVAIDEPPVKDNLTDVLNALTQQKFDALVGPLYPTHFQAITNYANAYCVKNIIPFSSKVKQVETNRYVYLLNTPQEQLNKSSFELFHSQFAGSRCVVVRTVDSSESALVNYWMDKMLTHQYELQSLSQTFTDEEMKQALVTDKKNVLIIDGSNKQAVLDILQRIQSFKAHHPGFQIAVIGHNAWQQFSMEYSELLGTLNTYLVAQDFYNAYSKSVIAFEEEYYNWFKTYPLLLHPRMGELGYDTGLYLFKSSDTNTLVDRQGKKIEYLQSNLKFQQLGNGGCVNSNLMFVRFTPAHKVELIEIKK